MYLQIEKKKDFYSMYLQIDKKNYGRTCYVILPQMNVLIYTKTPTFCLEILHFSYFSPTFISLKLLLFSYFFHIKSLKLVSDIVYHELLTSYIVLKCKS